jgi:hypothetical protein
MCSGLAPVTSDLAQLTTAVSANSLALDELSKSVSDAERLANGNVVLGVL